MVHMVRLHMSLQRPQRNSLEYHIQRLRLRGDTDSANKACRLSASALSSLAFCGGNGRTAKQSRIDIAAAGAIRPLVELLGPRGPSGVQEYAAQVGWGTGVLAEPDWPRVGVCRTGGVLARSVCRLGGLDTGLTRRT